MLKLNLTQEEKEKKIVVCTLLYLSAQPLQNIAHTGVYSKYKFTNSVLYTHEALRTLNICAVTSI